MSDIYFKDYNKKKKNNSKYNTSKIPLTQNNEYFYPTESNRERPMYATSQPAPVTTNNGNGFNQPPTHIPPKKVKKRRLGCTGIFISLFLVISIIFVSVFGYVYNLSSKTEYQGEKQDIFAVLEEISHESAKVYNILLIGTDKAENGKCRSDSMMMITIDREHEKIKMTSFMRDLWVEIPNEGNARLNAAFNKGGAELLTDTIYHNFKIKTDNYILVDFKMFEELIDAIGGVKVDITQKEADFINRTTHATVKAGENTLNGDYALIYCRIRKLDSDFYRTQRQRKVITAIIEQIKSQSIFETVSDVSGVLPLITTDISPLKMTLKLFSGINILKYSSEQLRIPVDGTYTDERINGQAVLVPDFEKNQKEILDFIYE